MKKFTTMNTAKKLLLNTALVTAVSALGINPVLAKEFNSGDWYGSFDTTVSYGASWRVNDFDPADVGKAFNNPAVVGTGLFYTPNQRAAIGRWSSNDDDGDLNYPNSGDLITHNFKVTSEFSFSNGNFGGFIRASAFYDFENADKDVLSKIAQERVGSDVKLTDAYVWSNHEIGEHYLTWRLGRQVVSWGESTFIQGGLNAINPVDVSKIRLAGSELKEAFEGINMLWGSVDLSPSVSIEAMAIFEYESIIPDPAGTYYSASDIATPGASYAMLGFGLLPQPVNNPDLFNQVCLQENYAATDIIFGPAAAAGGCRVAIPRGPTRSADDSGQYGAALRWFSDIGNGAEFGFYYLKYHSRLPLISGAAVASDPRVAPFFASASYWTEYPEDLDLFGISFNTTIGTWSLGGEVSYRPDLPLQIDDVEILLGALTPLNVLIAAPAARYQSQLGEFAPGEEIRGWHPNDSWQAQMTLTKLFGPGVFAGADQIVFVTEFGFNAVPDLHNQNVLRYNGPGTDSGGGIDVNTGHFNNPETEPAGFADDFSWGYRFVTRFDYYNAFGAVTVSPRLAWAHDVDGTTPGPGGSFIDGRKTVTVGVGFNYLDRWIFDLAYTDYMGGGRYNLLQNRDFFAASVRYSF
ncbi:MAG: hypothetical protein ACI9H8_001219 [Lysobacterales bacterium]|jgi:hypothetical protein